MLVDGQRVTSGQHDVLWKIEHGQILRRDDTGKCYLTEKVQGKEKHETVQPALLEALVKKGLVKAAIRYPSTRGWTTVYIRHRVS